MNIHQSLILEKDSRANFFLKNYGIGFYGVSVLSYLKNNNLSSKHYISGNKNAYILLEHFNLKNFIFNDISDECKNYNLRDHFQISKFLGLQKLTEIKDIITVDFDVILDEKFTNLLKSDYDLLVQSFECNHEETDRYIDGYDLTNKLLKEYEVKIDGWIYDWIYRYHNCAKYKKEFNLRPCNCGIIHFKDNFMLQNYIKNQMKIAKTVDRFCFEYDIKGPCTFSPTNEKFNSVNLWNRDNSNKQNNIFLKKTNLEIRPHGLLTEIIEEQLYLTMFSVFNNLKIKTVTKRSHDPVGVDGYMHLCNTKKLNNSFFLNTLKNQLDYYDKKIWDKLQNLDLFLLKLK